MPIPLLLHGLHQNPAAPPVHYEPFGPWLVPWRFRDLEAEYAALRRGAGLLDGSTQAFIECRGADRAGFLQRLLTNDVARLAPGAGCQAALLTDSAKLIATCLVLCDAEAIWLVCDLLAAQRLVETLERYHFSEDLALTNHERRWAVLAVEGPQALALIDRLARTVPALTAPLSHTAVSLDGLPVRLIRHAVSGADGVWCVVEAAQAQPLWRLLVGAGATPVGWEAFNIARLEAGVPCFGLDMDETNLLPETGLETTLCSQTKGCYLGQEIIARMATYGSPSKRLVGLLIDGEHAPQAGDRIVRGEAAVGHVTSSGRSLALKRPIAMGYVKRGAYDLGTRVEIVRADRRLDATIVNRAST